MRNYILRQYTTLTPNSIVLWHHGSCHTGIFFQTLIGWTILLLLYTLWIYSFPNWIQIIKRIIGVIGILIYSRFVLEFLNKYLDALVITAQGIIIFEWDGFLHYSLQQFDRDSIESITHSQDSIGDKLIGKWSIIVTIDHGAIFSFDNISSPSRIADTLRQYKQKHGAIRPHHHDEDEEPWWVYNEKFEILVETLGEVIKDYMGKHKWLPNKDDRDQ